MSLRNKKELKRRREVSGHTGGMDSSQVWRGFFQPIKEFGLYPEGNGKAGRGFKQVSVIIFSFHKIILASVWSKD